jgi:hypothetical protein
MAALFPSPLHRGAMKRISLPRKLATIAAPGLLGLVLGVGLFGAPAGALRPKAIVDTGVTCTDNWKAAVSGHWSTASDWSTGVVPTSSDNVCIKIAGTYKVSIAGAVSANTLTLGGSSGTQTLSIKGTTVTSSALTLTAATGSKISAHGVLSLKSKNASGSGYALIGSSNSAVVTVANSGTVQTSGGSVNPDYLRVNLTNASTGTTKINGVTVEDASDGVTTLTNDGTFSVGTNGSLTLSGDSSFTQSGGTFTNSGALKQDAGTFTQSGGTDSGNPVSILDATLADAAASGTFTFDLFQNDNLGGTIPSGQTVDLIGNPSYNTVATLSANLTNDGTLVLDSESTTGSGYTSLYGPNDTVTNAGTLETEGGTVNPNYLRTSIVNSSAGKLKINGLTDDDADSGATTVTNDGTFSVGSSGSLTLTGNSSFTQSAGTFTNSGAFEQDQGTFTQNGGTDSGNAVTVLNGTLADAAASGSFTFNLFQNDDLSGTIPSGQTVNLIGNPSYSTVATLTANLTNDGTLVLDSQSATGSGSTSLYGPTVSVTNAGTIETEGGTVNPNYLRTNLTNNSGASVDINGLTDDDGDEGDTTLTNKGTFSIGSSGSLTVSGSAFTQDGGTFSNGGAFTQDEGTFTQTAGTNSGNAVTVLDATLADTAEMGTFTFDLFQNDNLGGTIPSGQTVDVIGNPTYFSITTLSANLTNDGTLVLDSQNTADSGYAILNGPTYTVTNAGTFETEGGTVQPNYLRTNLTNTSTGKTEINGLTTDDGSGGDTTLTNSGTLSVADGDGITISGSSFVQTSTGTFEPTVDVAANKAYGLSGSAYTLAGTLDPTTLGTPAANSTYNVIANTSQIIGSFTTVTGPYTVSYPTGSVTLKAT